MAKPVRTSKPDQSRFQFSLKPGQTQQREIPAAAFCVAAGTCQFAAGDDESGDLAVTLFARSTKPVKHWYWGDMYHDFDGMQVADSIAVDYCHDDDEIIGVGHKFDVKQDGLWIGAKLQQQHDGDRVSKLRKHAQLSPPVPYEASIDFRGDILAQEVPEGFTAEVNGQTVTGPALIFREWPLRRVAICPSGRDSNTRAQFSSDVDEPITINLFSSEGTTMKKKAAPAGDDKTVAGQQTEAPETPEKEVEQQQTEPKTPADKPKAESQQHSDKTPQEPTPQQQFAANLKKFTERFGAESGAQYLAAGKTYAEACDAHIDALVKQLSDKDEQIKTLSEKLNGLHTGEDSPATLGATEDNSSGKFAHLGKSGAFADSIKLPK